ncbi:MAG: YggS family pyridoxal phosphate-dependent enzyme [Clostridiales bacterium]|nr:YggS family pyridoxal phosphate-dependent enzyme [Clostridiales bacterium]
MLKDNLNLILDEISNGNNLGEKITLLGATKFVQVEKINEAISLGLSVIGENKAQEFRDKFPFYAPCEKHFIGTLQENKLKYLVGKADSIDSVTSIKLLDAISKKATELGVRQKIMIEINAGDEISKTGASFEDAKALYKSIIGRKEIELIGIMGMLPITQNEKELADCTVKLRDFYELVKAELDGVKYLSVGMSGDYKIAIRNGSNMIRIGSNIFGQRNYGEK